MDANTILAILLGLALVGVLGLLYVISVMRMETKTLHLEHKIELLEESEGQRELEENYNQDFLQMNESLHRNKIAVDYLYEQLEIQSGDNPIINDDHAEYMHDIDVALDIIARGGNPSEQTPMPADDPLPFGDHNIPGA